MQPDADACNKSTPDAADLHKALLHCGSLATHSQGTRSANQQVNHGRSTPLATQNYGATNNITILWIINEWVQN